MAMPVPWYMVPYLLSFPVFLLIAVIQALIAAKTHPSPASRFLSLFGRNLLICVVVWGIEFLILDATIAPW